MTHGENFGHEDDLARRRRDEIVAACERLCATRGFREISVKDIGAATTFGRTSVYNYFRTKEEIFLALMEREYLGWAEDLRRLAEEAPMTAERFAHALGMSLEGRGLLLRLLSMNHYDMEAGSRPERLAEFKRSYGAALDAVDLCLRRHFPAMTAESRQGFLYAFFPFMFGIHPYTSVTEKQRKAMEDSGIGFAYLRPHELVGLCVTRLLGRESAAGEKEAEPCIDAGS